jgi:alpha-glucosidase
MSTQIFSNKDAYRFIKVEQYFDRYKEWEQLGSVVSHAFETKDETLTLDFKKRDGKPCSMLIQFPRKDTFRVRFNPGKTAADYPVENTRSVIQDNFRDLKKVVESTDDFQVLVQEGADRIELLTQGKDNRPVMKLLVTYSPFAIKVFNLSQNEPFLVWQTADTPIYFTANGEEDYAIIQSVRKPAGAKYIGFGEQGGHSLSKNTAQMNYFNFDNMRYRQVYDCGPLDAREPLYHSDPVFFEFDGVADKDSVNATFIDNPGQLLIDVGYLNSSRYMFGTRFGDLDYYLFTGNDPSSIVDSFTSIVGRSRLKPRYILGYHQGCYGYERRDILEWAADKYREYQIPLDGLHVDVDIQHNYQTFTIDTDKFPDPYSMFHDLKARGIKCSTNITPVISREDPDYSTYTQARDNNYFVLDFRHDPDNPESKNYQLYGSGNEYCPNNGYVEGFNTGQPYIGGVYYGNDANNNELGTSGHYADFGRKEVRHWWGTQYQYLFDMGLEMVWQDMTTPAIRENRGDMKGFPFRLKVTDDFLNDTAPKLTPAIKVWNLYSYNLHKATYHGLNKLKGRDNIRNFIIGRGSFSGSHRFTGLWTGDNSSDWDFLKMNVSQVLSLGMCGVVINGQDIGGFETALDGGAWASPELLIRWTAAGAFLPWFRNHYVRKGRKEFQEPFMYVEWFDQYKGGNLPEPQDLYRMVLPICKHYIELRYRLMQLFYDAMFENTLNGLPICRPLFLNEPGDKSLYNDKEAFIDNEFFVGKDLLVAPVLDPQVQEGYNNKGKRDVYLPSGSDWYCFVNNTMPLGVAVEGGTTVRDFDANLNINGNHIQFIVPIFVRAGAIIPTIEIEQYVGQLNREGKPRPVTLNIYPGDKGAYTLYLDDGVSRSSAPLDSHPVEFGGDSQAKGEYRQTDITHNFDGKKRNIKIERVHDNYTPPLEKYFFVAILHDPEETKGVSGSLKLVTIDGQKVGLIQGATPEQRSYTLLVSSNNAWYYNENINVSFIKVFDDNPIINIAAEYF